MSQDNPATDNAATGRAGQSTWWAGSFPSSPVLPSPVCLNHSSAGRSAPLRSNPSLASCAVRAAEATGQSINQLVVASVRKALPSVVSAMLSPTGRVTNVDPLPEAVLRRLYSDREDDDASIRRMVATQPLGAK